MVVLLNPADPNEAYGPYFEVPVDELRKLGFEKEENFWVKRTRRNEFRLRSVKLRGPDEMRRGFKDNVVPVRRMPVSQAGPDGAA